MTPEDWKIGQLGELCSIEIGGTPSRNNLAYWDAGKTTDNYWVSIKDLSQRIVVTTDEKISDLGVRNSNVKLQSAGTVLLSFKLTIGRVAYAGVDLYTNEAIAGLRSEALDPDFLFHGLQSWDLLQGVDQAIKGATLNKAKLKEIAFAYPEAKKEQIQIAAILSTIDKAIEQTEAIIAKQQRIKTGLMQDLLTRGIDEHGNLRSEDTHAFKDSPLGRIPMEWDVSIINECVQADAPICYGILMPGAFYDGGVPVIKVKNVFDGRVSTDDLLLTSPAIDRLYKRSRLKSGDLLLTIRGTTGRVALVPAELDGANITQDTARIRLVERHSSRYFYHLLQAFYVQDQIALHTLGQAVKGINIGEIKKIQIKIPGKHEQDLIAKQLDELYDAYNSTLQQLAKLRRQKTALMQDLLTGKVRVTALLEASGA